MSEPRNEQSEVDWRAAMADLRAGKVVDVPCTSESDFQRREGQIAKRSEKQGLAVEMRRGEGVLHIQPLLATSEAGNESDRRAAREDRRRERGERRDTVRAERGEFPDRDD